MAKFAKWLFIAIAMGAVLGTSYYLNGVSRIAGIVQTVRVDFIDQAPPEQVALIGFVCLAIVAAAVYSILD